MDRVRRRELAEGVTSALSCRHPQCLSALGRQRSANPASDRRTLRPDVNTPIFETNNEIIIGNRTDRWREEKTGVGVSQDYLTWLETWRR